MMIKTFPVGMLQENCYIIINEETNEAYINIKIKTVQKSGGKDNYEKKWHESNGSDRFSSNGSRNGSTNYGSRYEQ